MGEKDDLASVPTLGGEKEYDLLPDGERLARGSTPNKGGRTKPVRVYDIQNCGSRSRFVIRGKNDEPFIVHNCVQATARDLLADALLRIEAAGYPVIMHTHDEIVAEVPIGFGSIDEFETIMKDSPEWAATWPLGAAGGWRGARFRK